MPASIEHAIFGGRISLMMKNPDATSRLAMPQRILCHRLFTVYNQNNSHVLAGSVQWKPSDSNSHDTYCNRIFYPFQPDIPIPRDQKFLEPHIQITGTLSDMHSTRVLFGVTCKDDQGEGTVWYSAIPQISQAPDIGKPPGTNITLIYDRFSFDPRSMANRFALPLQHSQMDVSLIVAETL